MPPPPRVRHRRDDFGQAGAIASALAHGPDQRHGLGRIADIVARPAEEHGIEAAFAELSEDDITREEIEIMRIKFLSDLAN